MKIAIVTTVRAANNLLESFLDYHLSIGFDRIYLFFDDPKEYTEQFNMEGKICLIKSDGHLFKKWQESKLYPRLQNFISDDVMTRQLLNASVAIDMALDDQVEWLLHIDIDELFFYQNGKGVRPHFLDLSNRKADFVTYVNHEAIPEKLMIDNCFLEVSLFKRNVKDLTDVQKNAIFNDDCFRNGTEYFNFYMGGKAAARVQPGVIPDGVHDFTFEATKALLSHDTVYSQLNPVRVSYSDPCILHFPCCGFNNFWSKYKLLGNFSDQWFGVYEISSILPKHVQSRDVVLRGDVQAAKRFYEENFVKKFVDKRDVYETMDIFFRIPEIFKLHKRQSSCQ